MPMPQWMDGGVESGQEKDGAGMDVKGEEKTDHPCHKLDGGEIRGPSRGKGGGGRGRLRNYINDSKSVDDTLALRMGSHATGVCFFVHLMACIFSRKLYLHITFPNLHISPPCFIAHIFARPTTHLIPRTPPLPNIAILQTKPYARSILPAHAHPSIRRLLL